MAEMFHKIERKLVEVRRAPLKTAIRDFGEALEIAKHECRWHVTRKGAPISSEIDALRFGGMPNDSLKRLQMLADHAAKYHVWDEAVDRFNVHHKLRTNWRKNLPRRLGFIELLSFFKSNQLSGNAIASLTAAANIAERGLTPKALDALDEKTRTQLVTVVNEIRSIVKDDFGNRYRIMGNRQKRGVAREVAGMAGEFLAVVNPPLAHASAPTEVDASLGLAAEAD